MAKNLSIRKVPPELEKAILAEAKKHKTTKTQVVLRLLKEAFQMDKGPSRIKRDVRQFFGKMTWKEYHALQKSLGHFEEIEKDMWT